MSTDHDPAEVRRVLRDHGHEVGERGRISDDNLRLYEQYTGEGGYGGGVSAADFPGGAGELGELDDSVGGELGEFGEPEPLREEQSPRDSRPKATDRARALWSRGGQDRGRARTRTRRKTRARPKREWIPTGPMIERIWLELAQGARKIPPLQRVMAAQAPMAGIVLQDAARDTFIDRLALQNLARGEGRLEAANAMLGPPFWTAMIVRFGSFEVEQVKDEQGRPLFHDGQPVMRPVLEADGQPVWHEPTRVMIGGLRMGLMSWLRIGQRHAEEIMKRAEVLEELGDQADELVKWILSPERGPRRSYQDIAKEARMHTEAFLRAGQYQDNPGTGDTAGAGADEEQARAEAGPAPAVPGAAHVGAGLGWPPGAAPDGRTLGFTPPDPAIASQVVPRAPMPQA